MRDSADRLTQARIHAGFSTIAEAARLKNLHKQNLADHEASRRKIGPDHAIRYARAFRVSPEWILYGRSSKIRQIPVVGYIGAGSEFHKIDDEAFISSEMLEYKDGYDDQHHPELDTIDAPPNCPPHVIAVRVRGDSMHPVYFDGDIVIYSEPNQDIENFINKRCVCGLSDGRVLLKTVTRGQEYGRWTLTSFNAAPIIDVEVDWCAKIEWVQPK